MTITAETLKSIEKQASEGHYLDRLIAISDAVGVDHYAKLLRAIKEFMADNHKPDGTDALIYEASTVILARLKYRGIDPVDIRPIAWGLDWKALQDHGLTFLRLLHADEITGGY